MSNPVDEIDTFFTGLDDTVHSAVDSIGTMVKNIADNPLVLIETVALTAILGPGGLALASQAGAYAIASAAVSAANGGSIEQIAISAGAAYVGAQIGGQIGAATEFGTTPFSAQTSMLLEHSGGMATTLQSIVASSSGAAAAAALKGKPLDQVLTAGFTGGINSLVTDQLMSAGYNPKDIDTQVIARAVASASGAVLQGKDVGEAITRSTVATLAQSGMQAAADKIGSTYDQIKQNSETLQGISQSFNETKAAAQEAWNNLTSYESTAKAQAGEASGILAQFQQEKGEIDSLIAQYDVAKNRVENYGSVLESEGFVPRAGRGESTLYRRYYYPDGSLNTSGSYRASLRDGLFEDAPDKTVYQDQAAAIANQVSEANARASATVDRFYAAKAAYEDTVTNKLNPTKATYDSHIQNMVRLGEQAVQLSSETEKLGVTLGTAAGEYTVKQNELAIGLATEVAKTAGQDITTQLEEQKVEEQTRLAEQQKQEADALAQKQAEDTRLAQEAENTRLAQQQKAEDDARLAQLTEALKNPTELTGPTGLVAGPGTGIVTLSPDKESDEVVKPGYVPDVSHLDVIPESAELQPDNTFIDKETGIRYIPNDDGTVTVVNPENTAVDNTPTEDTTSPLSVLDTEKTDTTNPDAKVDTEKTDTTSPLSTLDTEKKDTTGPLSTLDTEKTDTTSPNLTGGSGDPGYDTYLALNPENPLSFAQWKWQSQEPELGESDEWKQKYKEWQAQNPDLKAGTLDVLGEQDPSFDPWDNPEEDVTEEEIKEDPTKEDPTKLPSTKIPVPVPTTTTTTVPKITLPATTTKTTTTIPAATTPAPSSAAPAASTDATGGIPNLTPGLTKAMNDYQLTGLNAIDTSPYEMASGGSTSAIDDLNSGKEYNPMATSSLAYLKPGLTRANLQYSLTGMPTPVTRKADGGEIMQNDPSIPEGHNPQFFSEGGLHNRYVRGDGDGTSDDVPAMLANGEFVIPADVVSSLGNGDNDSGAKVLDEFLAVIRKHKRAADAKHLPPDSKGALGYLAEAHSKVRA